MFRALSCIIIVAIIAPSCSQPQRVKEDLVLAFIRNKTITIQDFIRRSEYTIRPSYCSRSNYLHKKIVLNSLIAEKLTAIEMEHGDDKLLESSHFKTFLKGRREQAMRQIFYNDSFFNSVKISENEINRNYFFAGRIFQVHYINLPDIKTTQKVIDLTEEDISLDSIYTSLWEGKTPLREIDWFNKEPDIIRNQLFNDNIEKGVLLGPFETEENNYLIMEVLGWVDQPVITELDQQTRWNDVDKRLTEIAATKNYLQYVEELMSGKKMELIPDVFSIYASLAMDHYLKDDMDKKKALNKAIWDEVEQIELEYIDKLSGIDPSDILFIYDNKDWTVKDFNDLLRSHPLVFRKKKMKKTEFYNQLKFAMADVLRDMEITNICYDKDLDHDWRVISNVDQWYDAYASKRYIEKRSKIEMKSEQEVLDFFDPVVDSLQQVYSEKIRINMDAFENIDLTSIDMMVTQQGLPYPIVVPSFPIITSDSKLNYGKKMDALNEN